VREETVRAILQVHARPCCAALSLIGMAVRAGTPVSGITFVRPIPEAVQLVTTYSAAVATNSKHPDEARKLIAYFSSPEAAPVLTKLGLQPIAR
jgi:ABC-type molybdate transport system substrate-binding protein